MTNKSRKNQKGKKRKIRNKRMTKKRQRGGSRFSHGRTSRKSWLYNFFTGN